MKTIIVMTILVALFGSAAAFAAKNTGHATATPPSEILPPSPFGKCKVDAALREQCTAQWNKCKVTATKHPNACKTGWRTCCSGEGAMPRPTH